MRTIRIKGSRRLKDQQTRPVTITQSETGLCIGPDRALNKRIMTTSKKALITGITGQDGSYLAELLLEEATPYTASNAVRPLSTPTVSIISIRTPTRPIPQGSLRA